MKHAKSVGGSQGLLSAGIGANRFEQFGDEAETGISPDMYRIDTQHDRDLRIRMGNLTMTNHCHKSHHTCMMGGEGPFGLVEMGGSAIPFSAHR